jgi:hypothetical protein
LRRLRFGRRLRPLHLLHVGKTGGTAVRTAVDGRKTADFRIVVHGHDFVLPDVSGGEPCIFFVRDPATRFVSSFYSRRRQGRPLTFQPWTEAESKAFSAFASPSELARALSSEDDENRAAALDATESIGHVREPLSKWLVDATYLRGRLDDVLFVGAQEHLDEDFARLKEMLGLPKRVRLPRDDVAAHRNPQGLDYGLDDVGLENVRSWYAADYALLEVLASAFPHLPAYA